MATATTCLSGTVCSSQYIVNIQTLKILTESLASLRVFNLLTDVRVIIYVQIHAQKCHHVNNELRNFQTVHNDAHGLSFYRRYIRISLYQNNAIVKLIMWDEEHGWYKQNTSIPLLLQSSTDIVLQQFISPTCREEALDSFISKGPQSLQFHLT